MWCSGRFLWCITDETICLLTIVPKTAGRHTSRSIWETWSPSSIDQWHKLFSMNSHSRPAKNHDSDLYSTLNLQFPYQASELPKQQMGHVLPNQCPRHTNMHHPYASSWIVVRSGRKTSQSPLLKISQTPRRLRLVDDHESSCLSTNQHSINVRCISHDTTAIVMT